MATGLQGNGLTAGKAVFRLLDAVAAATAVAPTIADPGNARGSPTIRGGDAITAGIKACKIQMPAKYKAAGRGTLHLWNPAGSGVITLSYCRLWGWHSGSGERWGPIGVGTDANKGKLNAANGYAFGETGADKVDHYEGILFPGDFDYLTAELGTPGGTNPTWTLDLIVPVYEYSL